MLKFIFWLSFWGILYTYIGYPLILSVWRLMNKRKVQKGKILPFVSLVVAVYNEEKVIDRKLQNLLKLDYPHSMFEVIISSDGSTDRTEERAAHWRKEFARLGGPALSVIAAPFHAGKAAALNRAVEQARGEIIVFSDARQILDPRSIGALLSNFSDPSVGAVSGELILVDRPGGTEPGSIGLYWRYEKWLRRMESDIDSTLGATGALYALRSELYRPIPEGTILDDVLIPMQAVFDGYRVVFEPEARIYDFAAKGTGAEFLRKVRTLAGNYQLLWEHGAFWSPRRNRVLFQYLSHKAARLAVPFFMLILFFSNLFLLQGFYLFFLCLQLAWYGLAVLGGVSYAKVDPKAS